ncbi:fatty acid desaturase [Photobacterium satsumensis]|uniref:fatty acid desaturase n=1 Tax=Photobacterium satsumensis TaxID=2910239 RepID=UPI003D120BD7
MENEKQWHVCEINRKKLKGLMKRSDAKGLVRLSGWLACLCGSGLMAYSAIGTNWMIPAFMLYGVLWAFSEPLSHECSHGTPFKSRWLNEAVFFITDLMNFKERIYHRWMHARHHTHTIYKEQDPEIQLPTPVKIPIMLFELLGVRGAYHFIVAMVKHARGKFSSQTLAWVPEPEHPKLIAGARYYLAIYAAIIVWAIVIQSLLPIVFFLLPKFYGAWLKTLFVFTQHVGLAEEVADHRLNSRTVYLNPVASFFYWNMNYHIEHHMYPLVPFHALPALHKEIKEQLPRTYKGFVEVYREMFTTLVRQRKDPTYFAQRQLPQENKVPDVERAA